MSEVKSLSLGKLIVANKEKFAGLHSDSFVEQYEVGDAIANVNAVDAGVRKILHSDNTVSFFCKSHKLSAEERTALGFSEEQTHVPVRIVTHPAFNHLTYSFKDVGEPMKGNRTAYDFANTNVNGTLHVAKAIKAVTYETGNTNVDGSAEVSEKYPAGTQILQITLGAQIAE